MNIIKLKKDYPTAYALYKARSIKNPIDYFDSIGIRILPSYSANGSFGLDIRRKKSKEESAGDHDWKMIRVSHINSYYTRKEANEVGIGIAFQLHEEIYLK
jgi:hypothetical protein